MEGRADEANSGRVRECGDKKRDRIDVSAAPHLSLDHLNAMAPQTFVAALGGVFEHSPWVAEAVCAARPFSSIDAVHAAMATAVRSAPAGIRLALLRAHPELAGRLAREGRLTRHSSAEQGGAGLDRLSEEELRRFDELNRAYREKFGFPFIIAVKEHTKGAILDAFEARIENTVEMEVENALTEVFKITRLRIRSLVVESSGAPN